MPLLCPRCPGWASLPRPLRKQAPPAPSTAQRSAACAPRLPVAPPPRLPRDLTRPHPPPRRSWDAEEGFEDETEGLLAFLTDRESRTRRPSPLRQPLPPAHPSPLPTPTPPAADDLLDITAAEGGEPDKPEMMLWRFEGDEWDQDDGDEDDEGPEEEQTISASEYERMVERAAR